MGRDLSAHWPEVFRGLDAETFGLRSQLATGAGWDSDEPPTFPDQRAPILGQVVLGTAIADLLKSFGVRPDAAIGYSLGESSALFATRVWTERDAMHARLEASPLFRTELAGPCDCNCTPPRHKPIARRKSTNRHKSIARGKSSEG